MVAVVSGSGLGLFNSSTSTHGGAGANGNPNVGRGRDQVYVNTTTGNLVVQSVDDTLSALGLDFAAVRTYNSQGLADEDNNDLWRLGVHQKVALTQGTVNMAGSAVTKTFGDGTEVIYTWNATRSRYESNDGDGANDFISWNGTSWTWTDGSSRTTEEYTSVSGVYRIGFSRDAESTPNTVTYNYTGSLLTSISMAGSTAQTVNFTYTGTDLTSVQVVSNSVTQTLTRYYYDTSHRLRQVIVDLTPADNTVPLLDANSDGIYETTTGQTYITTYTYDSTSKRVASITQSDGSSVAFTYQNVNGNYRLKTVTDAENRVTTFTYADVITSGGTPASIPPISGQYQTQDTIGYTQVGGLTASPAGWNNAALRESSSTSINDPRIGFDSNGNGLLVWRSSSNIIAQRYTRATNSWGPETILDSSTQTASNQSLSVDASGNAVAAWMQSDGTAISVYVSRYNVSTGLWSTAAPLDTGIDATFPANSAGNTLVTAINGSYAAVSWQHDQTASSGVFDLWVARMDATTIYAPARLESLAATAGQVSLAIDTLGNIGAVFQQSDGTNTNIYSNRFDRTAGTWSGAAIRDNVTGTTNDPRIAFDSNGNGILIYRTGNNVNALRYTRSTNSWGTQSTLDTNANTAYLPVLALDAGGTGFAAWVQSDGTALSVYAARFDGTTWGAAVVLDSALDPTFPVNNAAATMRISVSGNRAAVIWQHNQAASGTVYDAYVARYNGTAWQTPERVEARAENAAQVHVAVDSLGNVSAAFLQNDGTANSTWVSRYNVSAAGSYYVVPSGATWQSVANAVYGVNSAAAGTALQAAMAGQTLATGVQLGGFPTTLNVTSTVAPYYVIVSGDTWTNVTQKLYNTSDANAIAALQTFNGTTTLPPLGQRINVANPLNYTTGGAGPSIYQTTTVQDGLGLITTYLKDAQGRLLSVQTPAVGGSSIETRYTYDAATGNVATITEDPTGLNRVTTFTYDAVTGLLLSTRDSLGNTVSRTYNTNNQLDSESSYLVRDPDGAGAQAATSPLTTRFIYDGENHLRFSVSADGRVTEHIYDAPGQRTTTYSYASTTYSGAYTESALNTWATNAARRGGPLERADYAYDFRSNISTITKWAATNASGAGTGAASVTRFIYDQRGLLLTTVEARGEATSTPTTDYVTNYTYDGLGRRRTTTAWVSGTDTQRALETIVYDDPNRQTVISLANGLTKTLTYNRSGDLTSIVNNPGALSTTSYTYDAGGRLRVTTDPVNVKQYLFYDAAGRKIGVVDGDGSLTEFIYDRANELIKTVRYSTLLASGTMTSLSTGAWNTVAFSALRTEANAVSGTNQVLRNVYDASGMLVYTLEQTAAITDDQLYAVTKFTYDGAGRLIDEYRFANKLNISTAGDEILPAAVTVGTDATNDRRTRHFYNGDGLKTATLDGAGFLVENQYDAAGRLSTQIGYFNAVDANKRGLATVDEMRPGIAGSTATLDAARDITTRLFYDAQGRQIGVLDGERYLTETVYDVAGHVLQSIRYNKQLTYTLNVSTFNTLRNEAIAAPAATTHTTTYTYDGLGQVLTETNFENTQTKYTYDIAGNVIQLDRAFGTTEVRTTATRYDVMGRVTQELTAEGSVALAALGGTPTQAQVDAVWNNYGVKYTYDNASRRTSATVRPNDTQTNTTYYYYDNDGRLRFELNPLGRVTENRYNALGQLVDRIEYYRTVSIPSPTGGLLTDAVRDLLKATETLNLHEKTTYNYTLRGAVRNTLTAALATTSTDYNVFGEVSSSNAGTGFTPFDYTYDTRGYQKLTTRGGVTFENRSYDAFGRLGTVVDARGNATTVTFDRLGRELTSQQVGDANSTLMSYDAFSRVLTLRDKLLNSTGYVYDDTLRTVTVTTPETIVIVTGHNRHGETLTVTAAGNTTTYAYDKNGKLTGASDNLGSLEGREYDRAGRQITAIDARLTRTSFTYDSVNRMLTRMVDSAGAGLRLETTYTYDPNSRILEVKEPGNRLTRTEYDRDGRVTAVTVDPNGTTPSRTVYVYDEANHVMNVTEGAGSVQPRRTRYVYDVLGRRTDEYVDPISLGGALDLRTQYRYDNNNNVTRKIDAKGNSTWYTYDAQNRLTQTIDALGGVTELTYDSQDRVVTTRRYFTTVSTAGLGDTPAKQAITTTVNDRVTRSVYDRDGRERYTVDTVSATGSPGSVTETGIVTERTFDANGNVTRTRMFRNSITVPVTVDTGTIFGALAVGNDNAVLHPADHVERTLYDLRGRAEIKIDGAGAVTRYQYDASGNVTQTTAYANTVSVDGATDAAARSLVNSLPSSTQDRTTRFWSDTAGRARFSLDAEGYLVEGRYLDATKQELSIVYAIKPTLAAGATLADVAAAAALLTPTNNQTTTKLFDVAGNVIQVTDALGRNEYFGYDAVGNKIKYVNKKALNSSDPAYTWTYEYDGNHRLIYERSPSVTYGSVNPSTLVYSETSAQVVTRNEYDNLGNVSARTEAYGTTQARVTRFEYDSLGRQTATVSPTVGVYTTAGDTTFGNGATVVATETQTEIRSETSYDVFGNAFRNRLVAANQASVSTNGTYSYKAYDNLGRVRYEVDALNQVTGSKYDVFGNKFEMTRYVNPLGSTTTWQTASSLVTSQVGVTANATADRTITSTFDRLGREISVKQPSVRNFAPNVSGAGGGNYDAQPSTEYVYNAFGEVIRTSLQINTVDFAHTYSYYDRLGRKSAELDPKRYLTLFEYDETGDLTRQLEYARPTTGTLNYTTYGTVNETTNATHAVPPTSTVGTPDVFQGYDREVTYTYDQLNQKTSESRRKLEYASLNSPTGVATAFDGVQTTTFGYDVLGNQTVVKNSLGATFTFYDVLGRVVGVAQPSRELGLGGPVPGLWSTTARIPFTRMARDANGNLLQTIEYYRGLDGNAFGATPPDAPALPAAPASHADDRTTTMVVDNRGNTVRSRDAAGADRYASYNARGDVAKEWQPVTNAITGASEAIVKIYRYDSLGQQTQLVESQRYNGVNTDFVTRISDYNVFGEIVAKYNSTTPDAEKEYFDYDVAGRVWRTNSGDGVAKVYMYDLAGNATLELRSKSVDLDAGRTASLAGTYTSAQVVLNTVVQTDLMRTETVYDANGNVTQRRMPTFDIDTRYPPVAANILITTISGQVYVNWQGALNAQIGQVFSYRIAGSSANWETFTIQNVSSGVIGANVSTLTASQNYEFRITYNRGGEIVPFAESMGTFRFDRATTTTAAISQVSVDPASQVATLSTSYSNGTMTWTAPTDATVTATIKINGGSPITVTRSGVNFTVNLSTPLANAGTYAYDIEYFRAGTLIAKKSGNVTSNGTSVARNVTTSTSTNTTAAPYNTPIATPQAQGTGASRAVVWAVNPSTSEGTIVVEYQYRRLADPSYSTPQILTPSGSTVSVNVGGLAQGGYEYILQYRIGSRYVAYQHGYFDTVDAASSNTVSTGVINSGFPGATPPINTITGTGGGNTASFEQWDSEYVYAIDDDGAFFTRFYVGGGNSLIPTWTGGANSAWVVIEYMTIGDNFYGQYLSTYSNSVSAVAQGTMTRGVVNNFILLSYTGSPGEIGPVGVDHITRMRVYTSQGGSLIADTNNPIPPGRGITWAAPAEDTNITAKVYYENGTNNWVYIADATRGGNTFAINVDVIPNGSRRIKVDYHHPGESWAFNTAIATINQVANVAPTLSGQTSSNHDPAWLTPVTDSWNTGTISWSSPCPPGGTVRLEYWNGSGWSLWQQWTSGTNFSYDFSPIATTTATNYSYRIVYRAAEGWNTQYTEGLVTVLRTIINDPATLFVQSSTVYNSTTPATVIAPAATGDRLSWTQAKESGTDTVTITYSRNGVAPFYTDTLSGSGPSFFSQFPQLTDQSATDVYWTIEYKRAGQTNSYARATGFTRTTIATVTTYPTLSGITQAAGYPSTVGQVSLPTYRQSDRALIFTTPANAIADIRFIFNNQPTPLTVTAEGAGYKVILPGVGNGAYSYSITYQGAGNPYAMTSGSITVTNNVGSPSNETISVNAQRADTSLSVVPTIGQALFVDPPYAIYHQEYLQGGPGGMGPGYYLVLGAQPWAPENTSFSGGWYYSTMPSEADPDGAYSQVPQANYTYQADRWTVSWPGSASWLGMGANLQVWPVGNPTSITTPTVSRPDGNGFVADVQNLTPGTYGYRINFTREGAFAPIGFIEGTLVRGATNSISVSASVSPPVVAAIPTTSQKFDRWGNVIETVDAAGNLISYRYNGLNLLVQTLEAQDYVIDKRDPNPLASVNGTLERVETTNSYDIFGRLIETQDGYDQASRVTYNAAGQQITKRNADWQRYTGSAVSSNIYDVFGNLIQSQDEIGYLTRYKYDRAGRITEIWREIRLNAFQSRTDATSTATASPGTLQRMQFSYDAAGRRITETNGASETVTYAYDFLGNVTQRRSAMGFVTNYLYNFDSKKTQETDAIGGRKTWSYDAFGVLKTHGELTNTTPTVNTGSGGGNVITYSYNFAGLLFSQTSTLGQNIAYNFDRAGNMTSIVDTGYDPNTGIRLNRVTSHRYDAAGRMVRESVVADDLLHQDSRYRYDAHNRVAEIDDPDYREKVLFDVNGNRAYIQAYFVNHEARSISETIRYTYDEMNRITRKAVHNLEGAAVTHNTDLTYNARGDRVLQVADDKRWSVATGTNRWSDTIQGFAAQVDEAYVYDGLGRLETVQRNLHHLTTGNNPTNILLHSYGYDLANRRTSEFHRAIGANHLTEDRQTTTGYDSDGRITTQTTQKRNDSNVFINESRVTYGSSTYGGGVWSNGFDSANNLRTYQVQTYTAGGGNLFLFTYRNNFLLGDSYIDAGTDVSSTGTDHPEDGHTVRTYNVNRELVKFKDLDPDAAEQTQQFTNNQAGQALSTIKGDFESDPATVWKRVLERAKSGGQYNTGKAQYFFYVQGNLYGSFGQLQPEAMITGRFDVNSTPISESYPSAVPPTVITQSGDTLRTIASRVFGDAGLWYVIAEENGLADPDAPLGEGQQLRIPNNVLSLSNKSDSFKPFDISQVMGDTTPSQPPPPAAKGCGVLGMIIMIVVMVVAIVFTAGLMVAATPGFVGGFGAIMSAGAGALTGGAVVAAGTVSLTFAGGAIAAAAGSVASQLVGMAIGAQDKFDWKGVATAAIGGGVGAFLGAAGQAAQAVEKGYRAASMMSRVGAVVGNFGAVGNAVASSVLSQGIAVATGLQSSFNWKQVATAAISAPLADAVGTFAGAATARMGDGISGFAGGFAANVASGYVSKALGGKQTSLQILTDAFGNAVANSLTKQATSFGGDANQSFGSRISSAFETFGERNFGLLANLTKNPVTNNLNPTAPPPDEQRAKAQPIMDDGSGLLSSAESTPPTASDLIKSLGPTTAAAAMQAFNDGTATAFDANGKLTLDPALESYLKGLTLGKADIAAEKQRLIGLARSGDLRAFYDFDYFSDPKDAALRFDRSMTSIGDDRRAIELTMTQHGIEVNDANVALLQGKVFDGQSVAFPKQSKSEFKAAAKDLKSFVKYRDKFLNALAVDSLAINALVNFAGTQPSHPAFVAAMGDMRAAVDHGYFTLRPFTSVATPTFSPKMQQYNAGGQSEILIYREGFSWGKKDFATGILHELVHSQRLNDTLRQIEMGKSGTTTTYYADPKIYYDTRNKALITKIYAAGQAPINAGPGVGTAVANYENGHLFEGFVNNWYPSKILKTLKIPK